MNNEQEYLLKEKLVLMITEKLLIAGIKECKHNKTILPTIFIECCNPVKLVNDFF